MSRLSADGRPLDAQRPSAPADALPTVPRPRPRPTPRPRSGPAHAPRGSADQNPARREPAPGQRAHPAPTEPGTAEIPGGDTRPTEPLDTEHPATEHAAADLEAGDLEAGDLEAEDVAAGPVGEDQVAVWALVEQAQAGRAEAFGELYDRYADMVFRYLYHRVSDRQTAEDFTSETFVRALRRIDSLSFQGRDVGAWLVTIARNIVRDHVKSRRFQLEVSTADMRDADRATDGPEDAVLQGLTNAELLACVRQLGDEQRECIVLRFMQGLSVAETAAAMGKKDGAIKALQHRAVKRLAALLPAGLR